MTTTMLDALREQAESIRKDGIVLLKEHSGTHTPDCAYVIISPSGNQYWDELSSEGKRLQTRLLPQIGAFSELILNIALHVPSGTRKKLDTALKGIRAAVEQDQSTWWKTADEAVEGYGKLLSSVVTMLNEYLGTPSSAVLAIPDTNAFLSNPDIEHWHFDDIDEFEIILTPTVSSELDNHKVNHRNPEVREKALRLIRRIAGYRRRGNLNEGVWIIKDRISLRCIAREPDMSQTLSWFDPTNADDRFLATTLEIIRSDIGARTFIVTSDLNMQNKAELATIPFQDISASKPNEGET